MIYAEKTTDTFENFDCPVPNDNGNLVVDCKPRCACRSETQNCPNPIAWAVNINDKEMWLCEKCYNNVLAGAYQQCKLLVAIPY